MSSVIFASNGYIGDAFQKLVDTMFLKVDGCLVERTAKGYIIFGTEVKTIEEVKKIISESARSLNNSIKKSQ